jgi:hypothetical protein
MKALMFGNRKPRPPLTTYLRVDIELLMRRSIDVLGLEVVTGAEVVTCIADLPLDLSSPRSLVESADIEVRRRMNMMDVDTDITLVDGDQLGYPSTYKAAAAEGGSTVISVADDTARDPLRTVMELAYQYAYHYWRTQPSPRPLDTDPRTTNLLPVCFGLGVLASDASLYDQQWSQAGWSGWSLSRSGYYNAAELGYALALFARARGESNPVWAQNLRLDSRVAAAQAWQFFEQHEESGGTLLFDDAKIPSSDRNLNELAAWLSGDDLTFALAAGYALSKFDELPPLAVQAALAATHSGDRDLRPVAVSLLAGARHASGEVTARVRRLIKSRWIQTSLAAIQAADALGMDLSQHHRRISKLLDAVAEDAFDLLRVIGNQGARLRRLEPKICGQLVPAIKHGDSDLTLALLDCLSRIVDDPKSSLVRQIKAPDIRCEAMERWVQRVSDR